jgi:hypothetical protein
MSHKYQDPEMIKYLLGKNYKDFPSYYIVQYLTEKNITIIDKKENITEENSILYILFKKNKKNGVIFFSVSKDNLMKLKVTYESFNKITKTRKIESILDHLNDVLGFNHE